MIEGLVRDPSAYIRPRTLAMLSWSELIELWRYDGLSYRPKCWEIKGNIRRDKKEFVIGLVKKAEAIADNNDFRTVQRTREEFPCGRKSLDGSVKDFNDQFLIHLSRLEIEVVRESKKNLMRTAIGRVSAFSLLP